MILEVCANSYQSAINATEAGAHRIELCSELSVGGITPSFGLLKQVIQAVSIPVFVLIRPRSGDFVFSKDEFDIMRQDIQVCKQLGCDGIVSGVLCYDNTIDIERTKELVELSKPLSFTFHRAFDLVKSPTKSLEDLIEMGVNRVLSSGQELTAEKGIHLLKQLKEMSKGNITILPGCGISTNNAKLFKDFGFDEIHASASKKVFKNESIKGYGDSLQTESAIKIIKSILKNIS
ncbi:copper homeostasis protein CutC [Seonamhaeicola maritimus]|uniref:copper homeostasis protein CutC n=1 Tax=Seonamhaeicola maritimus TaxID=2591822 RepID=UPI0024953A80|nr:copper homeostasis protein CutC [Seonamhaeicola maritimus]